jgi:hypothetical protein
MSDVSGSGPVRSFRFTALIGSIPALDSPKSAGLAMYRDILIS